MKVLKDLSVEIPDTNSYHWNFEPFSSDDGIDLAVGFNSLRNSFDYNLEAQSRKRVLFNNWAPCEYASRVIWDQVDAIQAEEHFDYVLTICPYTAAWRNLNLSNAKYIFAFYPFSEKIIPPESEKKYDVIYHGGIHGREHILAIKVMRSFNYRFTSLDYGINPLTRKYLKYATDINLDFQEKITRISESKISICFNIIHVSFPHFKNIKIYQSKMPPGSEFFNSLKLVDIFKNYPWIGTLPQFKTRMHEAAISKTVNLVYKDAWNVAESYYEPNVEFIYFQDEADLNKKIRYVLENWESDYIQSMIDAAYQKAMRYTSKNFMHYYSKVINSSDPINFHHFSSQEFWH